MSGTTKLSEGRIFLGDVIIWSLLLREARNRIIGRLFGVPKEDAALLTAVRAGSLAAGSYARAAAVRPPQPPAAANLAIGAAVGREIAREIAGDQSKDIPFFGALMALSVLDQTAGPTLRRTARG